MFDSDGNIRNFVRIYVGDEDIKALDENIIGLDDVIEEKEEVRGSVFSINEPQPVLQVEQTVNEYSPSHMEVEEDSALEDMFEEGYPEIKRGKSTLRKKFPRLVGSIADFNFERDEDQV